MVCGGWDDRLRSRLSQEEHHLNELQGQVGHNMPCQTRNTVWGLTRLRVAQHFIKSVRFCAPLTNSGSVPPSV